MNRVEGDYISNKSLVRILVGAEHRTIRNFDEGFVGDGEFHLFGAGLCCLHRVDLLKDTFVLSKVVHHSTLDGDGFNLVEAAAVGLEVRNHGSHRDL